MDDFWDFLLFSSLFNYTKQKKDESFSLYMADLLDEEDEEDDDEYEEEWEDC